MPIANPDPKTDLEKHEFKDHEALLLVPVYNTVTGMYSGLTQKLAHITLRGDVNERFYLYGYSKEKSALYMVGTSILCQTFSIVLHLSNIMDSCLVKTKIGLNFLIC